MNIRNFIIAVFTTITICVAASEPSRILPDDGIFPIPDRFRSCFEFIEKIQDRTFTYNQAVPIIEDNLSLFMELYNQDASENFMYVWRYDQTLIDEFERLDKLYKEESLKPAGKKCADYQHIPLTLEKLDVIIDNISRSQKRKIPDIMNNLSFTITRYFESLPKTDPYVLPSIFSLATHKLLFMLYISVLLKEFPAMIGKYVACPDGIKLERDGEKPFIDIFDREQRQSPDILCGSRIFDHFNAMKPYFVFVDTDGKPVVVPPASGADGAAHS